MCAFVCSHVRMFYVRKSFGVFCFVVAVLFAVVVCCGFVMFVCRCCFVLVVFVVLHVFVCRCVCCCNVVASFASNIPLFRTHSKSGIFNDASTFVVVSFVTHAVAVVAVIVMFLVFVDVVVDAACC